MLHDDEVDQEHVRHFVSQVDGGERRVSGVVGVDVEGKLKAMREGVVGNGEVFNGPFGDKRLLYADWTASGKAYAPIEDYISSHVLPFYANTHTSTSVTGLQSTCFRAEARQIIQQCVNANSRTDVVLFAGTGATGAINKLVHVLGLKVQITGLQEDMRPVVFVGPFEHHSNLLPWRESNAQVVNVRENAQGTGVDKGHLKELLEMYCDRSLLIGSFSAASNVTGVMEDVNEISAILHRHGALAFWDYAAAGPYAEIDMNPVLPGDHPDRAFVHKDAVFISAHKFLGGINTPGVLVAKKRLFQNAVPADLSVGGGTVYFVTENSHRYLSNRIEREEGGTPDVLGAIKAGLAFQLKQSIGSSVIEAIEVKWSQQIASVLGKHPKIALLGPAASAELSTLQCKRLPIASFLIRHDKGRFLHYNFVSALLNDLYGIQTRGGCMCAGPYAQRLLGLKSADIDAIENELVHDPKHCEYLRPGFTRFSLAYFTDQRQVDFILQAVVDVAQDGWKLLPSYRFNTRTGEWKHKSRFTKFPGRLWLKDAPLFASPNGIPQAAAAPGETDFDYAAVLDFGKRVMNDTKEALKTNLGDQATLISDTAKPLRWFVLPSEALDDLKSGKTQINQSSGPESPDLMIQEKQSLESEPARPPVMDPRKYWERIKPVSDAPNAASASTSSRKKSARETAQDTRAHTPVKRLKTENALAEKADDTIVCADNSCFKPRAKDKFPARDTEVIRKENGSSVTSKQMIGQVEMDKAKLFPKPPKSILRAVGKAIAEWDMIEDGDKLLLGLSGGKDSLCLLHVLLDLQKRAPVKFELAACTIDPMTEAFDPSPLIPYLKALGVTYHYIKDPIFDKAKSGSLQGTSICSFCARMKRGALYTCARSHGYNKLVLAQHLDDLAESTLMGLFHNGHLRSMMAKYEEKKGDVKVIRPLVYVREKETKEFSYHAKLPVINENCPACFEAPQERRRMKKLLAKEEAAYPQIFGNIRRALVPLMDPVVLAGLKDSSQAREQKGKSKYVKKQSKNNKKPAKNAEQASNKEKG